MKSCYLVSLLLIFAASFAALADTIYLKDGTRRDGTIKHEDNFTVIVELTQGPLKAEMQIERKDILRIETKTSADRPADWKYQLLLQEARYFENNSPQDALGTWERIAAFCEETKGYASYARAAYEKLLALNPNHEVAAAKLRAYEARAEALRNTSKMESPSVAAPRAPTSSPNFYTSPPPAPQLASTESYRPDRSYSRANDNTRSGIPVVYAYSDGRQLRFALLGYGSAYLPTNYKVGARNYTSSNNCGSTSANSNRYTVGSFQDARNSSVCVPNSYFGISTGSYDTSTQTWRKR